jgi:hypothetical protein
MVVVVERASLILAIASDGGRLRSNASRCTASGTIARIHLAVAAP